MESRHVIDGIELYFPTEEREAADLFEAACERAVPLIRDTWGLPTPKQCRVYVMTSWLRFIFHSAPWHMRILWVIVLPRWFMRIRKVWRFCGGWTQRYRNRPAVGAKPPWLIAEADTTIGERIYVKEPDFDRKAEHVVCHELTHAYSGHLKLPVWLNEGMAMVSVDRYFESDTVRRDTLDFLDRPRRKRRLVSYQNLYVMKKDDIAYHYVRGYWITRHLMEARPGLLPELLKKKRSHWVLHKAIARELGMKRRVFWRTIDERVVRHFAEMKRSEGKSQ
jgi:hypothetical protein